jgi:hypothetical protein
MTVNYLSPKVASAAMSVPEETLRRWAKAEGSTAPSLDLKRFAEIKARDAVHEAGHAVAAWRLHAEVKFVQLRHGTGDLGGLCRFCADDNWVIEEIVHYSGVAAERPLIDLPALLEAHNLRAVTPAEWSEHVYDDDAGEALSDIVTHSESDRRGSENFDIAAFGMAQGLLRAHWRDVEKLAVALLQRVTVRGDELARILDNESN